MLDYARLTPGPGFRPFRAAFYYAQRLFVAPWLRGMITAGIASGINLVHPCRNALAGSLTPVEGERVQRLRERGFTLLGPTLSGEQVSEIRRFLQDKELVDMSNPSRAFRLGAIPDGVRMAAYRLDDILECPHLVEAANEPSVLRVISRYFGCRPTISSWGLRWSFPSSAPGTRTQALHRDADDWRTVKLFIYLSDVGEGCGPHVYAAGSHRIPATVFLRQARPGDFEDDQMVSITGPSGFGFIADMHGYHKGAVPVDGPRLILQIQYSILPVYAFLYPLPHHRNRGVDGYVNRLFLH